ncbi:MAG: hypothetical protein ACU0CO_17400 [Shimia sp.]
MRRFLALFLLLAPTGLQAQLVDTLCAPSGVMTERLQGYFMATKAGGGMRDPETMLEVWADARGGWLIVTRRADGTSCIAAMGEHWQAADRPEGDG